MAAPVGRRKRADILAEVLRYLQSGMTRRAACGLAGIDRSTLTRWIEHSNTVLRQVQSAEAAAEGRATALLVRAANDDWRAALAWLERRRPQEWAPRRTELSIAEEVSEPRHVTVDAVEAIVAFLPDESRGPVLEALADYYQSRRRGSPPS
ncbi:MAG: helix-turn-helix domain-containing protein [Chloroflexi bacterium]|nr:helix-turn-helix domain-containing protein [Chloroflexota bacterium]MBV9596255.1 helix-turn-helix domain-containing protein [Chloroflexota bacterium]